MAKLSWKNDTLLLAYFKKLKTYLNLFEDIGGRENQLHWVLDVEFNEDDSRVRKDYAPENLAIIRHIALNLLKQDKSVKGSIKSKRNRAGWDNDYLLKVLIG